jgi:hypothetical protein
MKILPIIFIFTFVLTTSIIRAQAPAVQQAVYSDVSIPLRDMKPDVRIPKDNQGFKEEHIIPNQFLPVVPGDGTDAALQTVYNYANGDATAISPLISFDGLTNASNPTSRVTPPDPTGDVGINHYVTNQC